MGVCLVGVCLLGERRPAAVSVAAAVTLPQPVRQAFPLAPVAAAFWTGILAAAAAASVAAAFHSHVGANDWLAFALLAGGAAAAQLFVVRTGLNQAFHTALVFVTAGALLLPPELVALMAVVQHVPEWIKERYPAYIQTFNIANFALDGLAGWAVAHVLRAVLPGSTELRWAVSGVAAAATIILLNHAMLGSMLRLARGHSLRKSELFAGRALGLDLVLGMLGISVAVCWRANPWVIPALVAPLFAAQGGFAMIGLLRESEQRFRAMFAAAPFGAELTDLDGHVVEVNAALERMLGFSAEEITTVPRDRYCDPEDEARDRELLGELVAGQGTGYELDRRFTTADGRHVLGKVAVALVPDADGRPKYRLAFVEDVTRRGELEDQLRQAHRLEAVGRLAGGVAHDFNNLLTAITGYAEFALDRLEPGAAVRGDVEEILKAGKRAGSLTSQLLAFSRKQMLQPKDLNFNYLVADMHNMLRRLIGEHIELGTVFYGPESLEVRADPGQLEQVVLNLVVNARDAMPDGGRITIETSSVTVDLDSSLLTQDGAKPGEYAVLAVHDTGVGIAPEDVGRLFEPFFTTKGVGEGTGLGLATVYGIVRQSGGFVAVTSAPGTGSTFEVYLPRVVTATEAGSSAAEPAEPLQGRERVLLVEDEPVVRKLVREMLVRNGYDVLDAADGPSALALVDSLGVPIDVLVTDVVMPSMSGRELAERLRRSQPETLVLYTSGYTDAAIMGEDELGERTHFLQKPFGVIELTEKIRLLVDGATAPRR